MAFNSFWFRLRTANPSLNDDDCKMTISVAAFRRSLEKAYEAGRSDITDAVDGMSGKGKRDATLDFLDKILGR